MAKGTEIGYFWVLAVHSSYPHALSSFDVASSGEIKQRNNLQKFYFFPVYLPLNPAPHDAQLTTYISLL